MQQNAPPLHEVSHIETPEHIALRFELAGVPSRGFAYIIDFFVQLIPLVAALVGTFTLASSQFIGHEWVHKDSRGQVTFSLLAQALTALILFCLNFGYFLFFEIFWRGQTPGKRAVGIRVMRDGGYPLDTRAAFLRNLLRAIDFLPGFYALGIGLVFWGRVGKRLGDYAAGTMVVKEAAKDLTLSESPPVATRSLLLPQERARVADFLQRVPELEAAAIERVARMLADKIATRVGRPRPTDPLAFLQEVHHDDSA